MTAIALRRIAARLEAAPLWTPIASLLLSLAWLIPNASYPWTGFHKDLVASAVILLVAIVVVARHWRMRGAVPVDALSGLLALLGAWCLLQWAVGQVYFVGHALVGFAYFAAAGATLALARAWEAERRHNVADFLFPAFLLAGLGTAALILKQWLEVEGFEVYVQGVADRFRPYGNLLQPNHAATVLVLGLVGLFWSALRGWTGRAALCLAGALLVCTLVLTESRIGYLSFLVLALAGLWLAPRLFTQRMRAPLLLLLVVFVLTLVALPWLKSLAFDDLSVVKRPSGAIRWTIWRSFLEVTLQQHPLAGLGFHPGMATHEAAAEAGYKLPQLTTWGHNAFVDVAVWFGFPAALALLGVCARLGVRFVRAPLAPDTALLAAAAIAIGLHAMVELPHGYAYFLLPLAMLVGALSTRIGVPSVPLTARIFAPLVVALGALLATLTHDFFRIEESFNDWRMMLQRIGLRHVPNVPDTLLLHQYRAYIAGSWEPEKLDARGLGDFEQAVILHPSAPAIQALVIGWLKQGDLQRAQHWADVTQVVLSSKERKSLASNWQFRVTEDPSLGRVRWPE